MLYIIDGTDEHEDQIGYSADNTNWSYIYKTKVFQIIDHKTYVRLQLEGGDDFNIEVNLVTNQLTWHTGSVELNKQLMIFRLGFKTALNMRFL